MNRIVSLGIVFLLCQIHLLAQISAGGVPVSFTPSLAPQLKSSLPKTTLPTINIQKYIEEDRRSGRDFRFAAPIDVDFSMSNSGTWTTLDNGNRIWQLKIQAPNALALALLYDDFYLPKGAKLYVYDAAKTQILGAYTATNNKANRKFLTGLIHSDTAIIEYFEPKEVADQGRIHIHRVMQAYDRQKITPSPAHRFNIYNGGGGFDSSLPCHININCSDGDEWQDHKRSVVRIMVVVEEGMGWCSGVLMNNTNQDGTPYVLSAFHCQDGYTPQYDFYRFDFNYESDACTNPATEPTFQSIVGCIDRAGRQASDFKLFELSTSIPLSYEPYFSGWNRNNAYIPQSTANIHHPNGDIKKISIDDDPATVYDESINWNNDVTTPPNHHFRIFYEVGTFEGGSSGSPLFDNFGRVIGQLHGGNSNCSNFEAFFGRMSVSWDFGENAATRLADWLAPNQSGIEFINAYDPTAVIPTASISGRVTTDEEVPVLGTKVFLYDVFPDSETPSAPIDSMNVQEDGTYVFTNVPQGQSYFVVPEKDNRDDNGVSTYDIVLVQQIILGTGDFDSPYKYLAADVNGSQDISTFDVVQMRQVILSIVPTFPDAASWGFARSTFFFSEPQNPFMSIGDEHINIFPIVELTSDRVDVNFIAYKMGDVNDNADTED